LQGEGENAGLILLRTLVIGLQTFLG
jgi:hypothetical protein